MHSYWLAFLDAFSQHDAENALMVLHVDVLLPFSTHPSPKKGT